MMHFFSGKDYKSSRFLLTPTKIPNSRFQIGLKEISPSSRKIGPNEIQVEFQAILAGDNFSLMVKLFLYFIKILI